MGNEFTVRKPKDLNKINSNDFGELLWWSYNFGISPEKLISLIHKYGNVTEEIKKHLKEKE